MYLHLLILYPCAHTNRGWDNPAYLRQMAPNLQSEGEPCFIAETGKSNFHNVSSKKSCSVTLAEVIYWPTELSFFQCALDLRYGPETTDVDLWMLKYSVFIYKNTI